MAIIRVTGNINFYDGTDFEFCIQVQPSSFQNLSRLSVLEFCHVTNKVVGSGTGAGPNHSERI